MRAAQWTSERPIALYVLVMIFLSLAHALANCFYHRVATRFFKPPCVFILNMIIRCELTHYYYYILIFVLMFFVHIHFPTVSSYQFSSQRQHLINFFCFIFEFFVGLMVLSQMYARSIFIFSRSCYPGNRIRTYQLKPFFNFYFISHFSHFKTFSRNISCLLFLSMDTDYEHQHIN